METTVTFEIPKPGPGEAYIHFDMTCIGDPSKVDPDKVHAVLKEMGLEPIAFTIQKVTP